MPDFTHGDKPMPSGWKPPGYDYRSQQQGNDMAAPEPLANTETDKSAQGTIEDKLKDIVLMSKYLRGRKPNPLRLKSFPNAIKELQAIITTETTKTAKVARLVGRLEENTLCRSYQRYDDPYDRIEKHYLELQAALQKEQPTAVPELLKKDATKIAKKLDDTMFDSIKKEQK